MKKFYELMTDDGYRREHIGFYETLELLEEVAKVKYGGNGTKSNPYLAVEKHEMYTVDDKAVELEDKKILDSLSKTQIEALKRNLKFLT